jgi:hypothetical protein
MNFQKAAEAANGKVVLPLHWGQSLVVLGGRYRSKPDDVLGVKMAKEIALPCAVDIPSKDFGVPTDEALEQGMYDTLKLLAGNELLYVGCAGGIGRTGTFLALLLKAWGFDEPMKHLRQVYMSRAVETLQQEKLVQTFKISTRCQKLVNKIKLRSLVFGWARPGKCLNTSNPT